MRLVRQHRRVPHKERLVGCFFDEVVNWLHRLAANFEPLISVAAAASLIAVTHAMSEATRLVISRPPLARLKADVAGFAQFIRQSRMLRHVAVQLANLSQKA